MSKLGSAVQRFRLFDNMKDLLFFPSCQHDWTFTLIMGRKLVFIVINKLISRPNVSRGAGYITQFSFRWLEVREHVSYSNGYGNAYKSDNRLLFERNMKESSANLRPRFQVCRVNQQVVFFLKEDLSFKGFVAIILCLRGAIQK